MEYIFDEHRLVNCVNVELIKRKKLSKSNEMIDTFFSN